MFIDIVCIDKNDTKDLLKGSIEWNYAVLVKKPRMSL